MTYTKVSYALAFLMVIAAIGFAVASHYAGINNDPDPRTALTLQIDSSLCAAVALLFLTLPRLKVPQR